MMKRKGTLRSKLGSHVAGIGTPTPDQDWEEEDSRRKWYQPNRGGCRLPTNSKDYKSMNGEVRTYKIDQEV